MSAGLFYFGHIPEYFKIRLNSRTYKNDNKFTFKKFWSLCGQYSDKNQAMV